MLAVVTATLVVFGLAMTYSAATTLPDRAGELTGVEYTFRQLSGAALGGILMLALSRIDYRRWRPLAWPILLLTMVLLVIPLLPFTHAIAPMKNGARRWIEVGPLSFQPSEAARFAVVLWCAMLAAKKGPQVRELRKGVLPFLVVVGVISLLILLEPSLSMAALVALLAGLVLFTAGAKIGHFLLLGSVGLVVFVHQIASSSWRAARWVAFLSPEGDPRGVGFQAYQSLMSVGSGGLHGKGFGKGQFKFGFLPFADSDYIFGAIGEEWGFIGVCLVVLLFGLFCWLGFRIARTAPDALGQYLATGLTASVGVTALLHMAVSLGLMPTTGLTLPFISAGRSSLVISLVSTGVLLSIGRFRGKPVPKNGER